MNHIHLSVWFEGLEEPVKVKSDLKFLPSYISRASKDNNFIFMEIYYNDTGNVHYYDNKMTVIDEVEFKKLRRKHLMKYLLNQ